MTRPVPPTSVACRLIDWLMTNHGQPQGIWSGDEELHGTDPRQGVETCAVVDAPCKPLLVGHRPALHAVVFESREPFVCHEPELIERVLAGRKSQSEIMLS